jgi:hypothetical protein
VRDKLLLTQQLVQNLTADSAVSVAKAMSTWWFNRRKTGGMRLTGLGYAAFVQQLDLVAYEFDINNPHDLTQRRLLDLDRKLQMPYYISATKGIPKKIIMFGSQESVWIHLYGDPLQFLDNYRP